MYDSDELLMFESIAAIKGEAANNGGETLGDILNPDGYIDDPFNENNSPVVVRVRARQLVGKQ
ncbi:hypothetical protein [Halohasta litorea]|uniref:hypothetical protein n=1 Tax=Halohasta litorea TaxID=869891 RepID=UPI002110F065|nr:hypothetical protein [Halohasta litorea]